MKTPAWFVLPLILMVSFRICAQSENTDLTSQSESKDKTREAMFNLQNPTAALTAGGSFYVSNPVPVREIDTEKAYLNPKFTSLSVILKSGQEYQLPGRLRLIDQRVEVRVDGEVFELDSPAIQAVTDDRGRVFIPGFDPVGRIKGIQWYEVAFAGDDYRLLVHEATTWQDPGPKNMFDTSEPRKTLKRVTRYYLIAADQNVEIDNMKDLLRGLKTENRDMATRYVRQNKLKNNGGDYLALLQFLQGER